MRFSETPVSDDLTSSSQSPALPPSSPSTDGGAVAEVSKGSSPETVPDTLAKRTAEERERAGRLIEHIGAEFSRLRAVGRSGAWSDLQDKVAKNGKLLIHTGTMTFDKWISTLREIEDFRKSEGGSSESPGDTLARWLTESDEKAKKTKKVKEVTQ